MTRLTAVIGDPVHHSLSPAIVNSAFENLKLDWKMLSLQVPAGKTGTALKVMRHIQMGGMSVTMPHKQSVAEQMDALDSSAENLGAVNCVVPSQSGQLIGYNTDSDGFLWSLEKEKVELAGARVLIFGAGGAARAVIRACILSGAERVGIRARSKAQEAAEFFPASVQADLSPEFSEYEILVNATPLGMAHLKEESPAKADSLKSSHILVDLVYNPPKTRFMELAENEGARAIGGLGMLVGQAVKAVHLWTGKNPDSEIMLNAARRQPSLR